MEAAVGAASSLLGKVLTKLSDDLVAAYVDSLELGHNSEQIKTKLKYVQGLLELAEGRDLSNNRGLQSLLEDLGKKADEAEDVLDELHYFKIQDDLDGTNYAAPDLGDGLRGHARHGRRAVRHTVGNCLPCFSRSPTQDDDSAVASNPHYTTTMSASGNHGDTADKLWFDRVAMSKKIKSVIEDIHSLCDPVSDLLSKIPCNNTTVAPKRPQIGAETVQGTLYGRRAIFEKTVDDINSCGETFSVLSVVGAGGIGKTTFTQHLYNHTRTKEHFTVRVWVCVSTDFDVLELTTQILSCIPATENEGSNTSTNLSKLQETIAQRLKSKRFLIVLDDIWKCDSEDEWKTLLAPFKNGEANGNMVLVTTRFPKLAQMMKTIDPIELQGLESNDFFTFFEACIFGDHKKPRHYEDELAGIAGEIANKLKGSPLAAKTVGRLLQKDHSQEHWNEVLQKHKWLNQQNNDDILPSLKISYSYLPFDLQKCFSFCALFPEDHRFNNLEINRFWIAIGIIDFSHLGDKNYLEELVENGFLMKGVDYKGRHYYVMHDLMHELSRSVSKQECINISDLNFRADDIPKSIRHLSITIENKYDEKFGKEMDELKKRIDIVNLRTLMIFREYEERVAGILRDTFKDINGLRVLFIAVESLDYLPSSFSKLIHLQYLKIGSSYNAREMTLPSTLSRFYHLKFLDLESWSGSSSLPKGISRLVNLRDFLAEKKLHSNVPEVGKMKHIQELKEFHVKKEMVGFELRELGELEGLGGELTICNLENVATKEEASEAKLNSKEYLKELKLVWDRLQPNIDADVLDGLQPHPNLRTLGIINHGGATGPSWLCLDIWVKSLETLQLEGVSWGTLPPFGQLPHLKELILNRISGIRQFGPEYGGIAGKCFLRLKKVVFYDLPALVEWVVEPNCHSFPILESIQCIQCPNLCVMPFSECSCANLCRLQIDGCPKLSLPPMPHTSTLTEFTIESRGSGYLSYKGGYLSYKGNILQVSGYNGALAFHHLDKVEDMSINDVSHISLSNLEKLKSLRKLEVKRCDNMFSEELDGSVVFPSVQSLDLFGGHLARKLLSKVFSFFPALAELVVEFFYVVQEEQVLQFRSSSSLRKLSFCGCNGLVLVPAEDGGGIQDMTSLQSLRIRGCGKLFSRWPMGEAGGAQTINPFPASLRELDVNGESSMQSMAWLSNLTSLTRLRLACCDNLTVDGFNPLITVNLKELAVYNYKQSGNPSVAADLLSEVARTKLLPAGSFQLERLKVDSISAVLVAPICNLLAATLHTLQFHYDMRAEGLTEEQETALQLLTSLQNLDFLHCKGLQSLPQGLHRLSSLKELEVYGCGELRLLPKEGFPTSLQKLRIVHCGDRLKEQVQKLKERYPVSSAIRLEFDD